MISFIFSTIIFFITILFYTVRVNVDSFVPQNITIY